MVIIGHVIIESIGYPGKAAFLQQPARPDAFRPATEKPLRRLATSFGNGSNAAIKIGGFRFTRRVIRLRAPKPAMGGGFMAAPGYLGSEGGRPFNSAAAHQKGGGNGVMIQRIEHPPETCARAISENLFLAHVAHTRGDDADHLTHAFALRVSVTHLLLGAFFEIDSNRNGKPGAIRPTHIRPVAAIANHIACHAKSPLRAWRPNQHSAAPASGSVANSAKA